MKLISHEFLLLVDTVGVIHSHVDSSPLTSVLTPASVFPRGRRNNVAVADDVSDCVSRCAVDPHTSKDGATHGLISRLLRDAGSKLTWRPDECHCHQGCAVHSVARDRDDVVLTVSDHGHGRPAAPSAGCATLASEKRRQFSWLAI